MKEFTSEESFLYKHGDGKGKVFVLRCPEEIPLKEIINQIVKIDGEVYYCLGVQLFAICRDQNNPIIREGERIGIMVSTSPFVLIPSEGIK